MLEAMTRSMQCPSIMIIYQNCYCGSAIIAMLSWGVVNGAPLRWKLAEGGLSLLVYIIESVRLFLCLFVCLFAVNAKTTAWIDAKRSGITKNDPESVLCCLKSPVLVFLGRYRDISGFSFAADRHFFYLSPFHFWLLPRRQNVKTPKLRNGLTPNAQELRRTTRGVSYVG